MTTILEQTQQLLASVHPNTLNRSYANRLILRRDRPRIGLLRHHPAFRPHFINDLPQGKLTSALVKYKYDSQHKLAKAARLYICSVATMLTHKYPSHVSLMKIARICRVKPCKMCYCASGQIYDWFTECHSNLIHWWDQFIEFNAPDKLAWLDSQRFCYESQLEHIHRCLTEQQAIQTGSVDTGSGSEISRVLAHKAKSENNPAT